MNICVIPARGGSKRIPRKNIKEFNGKPIIAYSIEAAKASKCFDEIIVSTDDNEIAEIAKKYGAKVPFIRPSKYSDDHIGTLPVVKHAIEFINVNQSVEFVCCLYATAPFIKPDVIKKAFNQLEVSKASFCFSVTSFSFPIQRALKITDNKRLCMFNPENLNKRSQDLEEAYQDAGQFYWGNASSFLNELVLFSEISSPYILPRYLVQDIDTPEDWTRAEVMYEVLKKKKLIK